jgi:hypothetical protein
MPSDSPAKRSFADNWLANTLDRSGTHAFVPDVEAVRISKHSSSKYVFLPIFLSVGGILIANCKATAAPSSTVSGRRAVSK